LSASVASSVSLGMLVAFAVAVGSGSLKVKVSQSTSESVELPLLGDAIDDGANDCETDCDGAYNLGTGVWEPDSCCWDGWGVWSSAAGADRLRVKR